MNIQYCGHEKHTVGPYFVPLEFIPLLHISFLRDLCYYELSNYD